jgi:hypothetical protein
MVVLNARNARAESIAHWNSESQYRSGFQQIFQVLPAMRDAGFEPATYRVGEKF